jgi:hypothetical protein
MFESRCLLSALAYSLTTNQSNYQSGQPVQMTFTETNTSAKPVNIAIGPANSGFDVAQNGKTVWMSNAGFQPQYLRLETLQPGQSVTLKATWNGLSNVGPSTVETGTFTVTNQQARTEASATFVIQPFVIEPATASMSLQPVDTSDEPITITVPATKTSTGTFPIIVFETADGLSVFKGPRGF